MCCVMLLLYDSDKGVNKAILGVLWCVVYVYMVEVEKGQKKGI